jgi:hypothetical protein
MFSLIRAQFLITARPEAFIGDEIAITRSRLLPKERCRAMTERHRLEKAAPQDRLAAFAEEARAQAAKLPPGAERDDLIKKARQAETGSRLADWAYSPGLQPPVKP